MHRAEQHPDQRVAPVTVACRRRCCAVLAVTCSQIALGAGTMNGSMSSPVDDQLPAADDERRRARERREHGARGPEVARVGRTYAWRAAVVASRRCAADRRDAAVLTGSRPRRAVRGTGRAVQQCSRTCGDGVEEARRVADLVGALVRAARPSAPDVDDVDDAARARRHHHDPVGEEHGLGDRVGDEEDGGAGLGADPHQLVLHPLAGDLVERAERLVHQQQPRALGERPGDRDPLLHAAGELVGVALGEVGEADQLEQLGRPGPCAASTSTPCSSSGSSMLPATVRHGSRPACWKAMP